MRCPWIAIPPKKSGVGFGVGSMSKMGVNESNSETGYISRLSFVLQGNRWHITTGDKMMKRLPKLKVAGSNPVSRSNVSLQYPET